jgi:hypothetical protein
MTKKINFGVLIVGLVMLLSTIGFAWTSSFSDTTTKTTTPEIPNTNVIDYELTIAQKTILLQNGITVVEYLYDPKEKCENCAEIKGILEALAAQFSDQVMLSEIRVSSADYIDLPRVRMESGMGEWSPRENVTSQLVLDGFCAVAVYPPIGCALSKLPQSNATKGI